MEQDLQVLREVRRQGAGLVAEKAQNHTVTQQKHKEVERRLQLTRSSILRKQRPVHALHASLAAAQCSLEQHNVWGRAIGVVTVLFLPCLNQQQEATAALQRQFGDAQEQRRQATVRKQEQLRMAASLINSATTSTWQALGMIFNKP